MTAGRSQAFSRVFACILILSTFLPGSHCPRAARLWQQTEIQISTHPGSHQLLGNIKRLHRPYSVCVFDCQRYGLEVRLINVRMHATQLKQFAPVHDQLYRRRGDVTPESLWLEHLPLLENDFQTWAQDMHSMSITVATNRPDKKQLQAILLAQAIMRLIMHRSFLIQRGQIDGQQAFARQRQASEAAVLDGAITVIETCKRLIQLGIHLSFWFLTVDLQIACLALCEYLQNQHDRPTAADISRPEEGLKTATDLLQEIADSGENPAVGQVLEAVNAIRAAWSYQVQQASQSAAQSSVSIELSALYTDDAHTDSARFP